MSLESGKVSEGKSGEMMKKAGTPESAARVTAKSITLRRQSTADRSAGEISAGFSDGGRVFRYLFHVSNRVPYPAYTALVMEVISIF
jgi:hypothetical protein